MVIEVTKSFLWNPGSKGNGNFLAEKFPRVENFSLETRFGIMDL